MYEFITLTDGYKLDHRRQYPEGTQYVYSNFTARASRVPEAKTVTFFGLQYFLQRYLMECAQETFFSRPGSEVCDKYQRFLDYYLGPNDIGTRHIAALHDLGYIPLEFRALPEGTAVPLRVPMFTVENTHSEFFWVTNYIETLMSSVLWQACTSATTARRYRILLNDYAALTGNPKDVVQWQGHDFSFRGMPCPEAAALSGAGHLLSFTGTDVIPAIELLQRYYDGEGLIGGSVPATEHSVMCAGGQTNELQTISRLLKLYPKGVLSVVSDTWDFWKLVTDTLPQLKDQILARDGALVIRPDSGDPVKIIVGDYDAPEGSPQFKGLIQCLWDIFGGTVNSVAYRQLDSHIGAIYGDSITEERAQQICEGLKHKGFASTNIMFGIGSYTYQYVTRDTYGFAVKATHAQINWDQHFLQKKPATDNGEKNSARGRICVVRVTGKLVMVDDLTLAQQYDLRYKDLLQLVWRNGAFIYRECLPRVRETVAQSLD